MGLKKFSGPAILVGIAILLIVVVQAGLGAKYEEGILLMMVLLKRFVVHIWCRFYSA
ncbi:MAG: hypothetical protein Ct9H90mP16_15090 [Candidatus Poseidoniales archaeon]|nr:MAG: hypothetical protein Ct9H90mP16_15090 [Candidatus Poseidoniales archaeon]